MADIDVRLSRTQAFLAMLPFLLLGIADVVLLLLWGLDPLWGFMILPPILAISALAWIAFRSGFARDRTGEPEGPDGAGGPDGSGTPDGAGTDEAY